MKPPYDEEAEKAMLSACLYRAAIAVPVLVEQLRTEDFYIPAHRFIALAIRDLWREGVTQMDAPIVLTKLKELGSSVTSADLMHLLVQAASPSNAPNFAMAIIDCSIRRKIVIECERIGKEAATKAGKGHSLLMHARESMSSIDLPSSHPHPAPNVTEFMADESHPNWLIEDMLEHQDRLMLTGAEGFGKSVFLRQLAVQVASGLKPFFQTPMARKKVLLVDCENSKAQVQRKMKHLIEVAGDRLEPDYLRIEVRNSGLDLTSRADSIWFRDLVSASNPDLLITGPLYKMSSGDPNDEGPARALAQLLDDIRTSVDCALIIETHSPHSTYGKHRELRPYGASLWRRWPEFGMGLRQAKDSNKTKATLEEWRGGRDERIWPNKLQHSDKWPWVQSQ